MISWSKEFILAVGSNQGWLQSSNTWGLKNFFETTLIFKSSPVLNVSFKVQNVNCKITECFFHKCIQRGWEKEVRKSVTQ